MPFLRAAARSLAEIRDLYFSCLVGLSSGYLCPGTAVLSAFRLTRRTDQEGDLARSERSPSPHSISQREGSTGRRHCRPGSFRERMVSGESAAFGGMQDAATIKNSFARP